MYAYQLVEESGSRELFSGAAHPYSRELIKCVLRTDQPQEGRLSTIPGALPDPVKPITGCSFEPRCPTGRDNPVCRTREPVLVRLGAPGAEHATKCHFPGTAEPEDTK